jgi:hypothetical protein
VGNHRTTVFIQSLSARAFSAVVGVCSQQLNYHFSTLVPYFVTELISSARAAESDESEKERFELVRQCAAATMAATSPSGITYLCTELGAQIEHDTDFKRRQWGCWLTEQLLRSSKAVSDDFVPVFLKYLLGRIAETEAVLQEAVR